MLYTLTFALSTPSYDVTVPSQYYYGFKYYVPTGH